LQLLDLRLVSARFLFALLATGAPVVFQRVVRSCRRPVLALIALVDFIGWAHSSSSPSRCRASCSTVCCRRAGLATDTKHFVNVFRTTPDGHRCGRPVLRAHTQSLEVICVRAGAMTLRRRLYSKQYIRAEI